MGEVSMGGRDQEAQPLASISVSVGEETKEELWEVGYIKWHPTSGMLRHIGGNIHYKTTHMGEN